MSLFVDAGNMALLWDVNACDIKEERYLFAGKEWEDTNYCNWLDIKMERDTNPDQSDYEKSRQYIGDALINDRSCSLEEIRAQGRDAVQQQKRIEFNECLIGLPKGRVDAVVCVVDGSWGVLYQDVPAARLQAWDFMLEVKNKLNLVDNIPVLIISDVTPVRVYTSADRDNDLKNAPALLSRSSLSLISAAKSDPDLKDFVIVHHSKDGPKDDQPPRCVIS